jgi:plastocyanin
MTRHPFFWVSILLGLFFYGAGSAAEAPAKTGVIKGTVTIAGKPAPDAVVSIEGVSPELAKRISKPAAKRAVIDQKDLRFIPRVLPVLVGTTVDFPNHDKTFHNVFSTSEAKKFDLGLYPSGQSRSAVFDKPGVVKILCNVHPNMEAYVVVKGHPYFAATDDRGRYELGQVPLGQYRLDVWHPAFGLKSVPFKMARAGEVLALDLDLKK